MDYWKMKTLLMVAFVGLNNRVNSRLTVIPSDVEVVNGTLVTLNCSTDSASPIVWVKEDDWGLYRKSVFNGSSIAAEFNTSYYISRPKLGSFNLEFLATEETASVYRCENEGDLASAKLDIIESSGQPIMSELRMSNDILRTLQRHDQRHFDHRPIDHGGNNDPKRDRDDTAVIAATVGGCLGFFCLVAVCKYCCCGKAGITE